MLRAFPLSLLLSQLVDGRRIGIIQKHGIQHKAPEVEDGKCQASCGEESLTLSGKEFVIGVGEGKRVKERQDSECLSDCFVGLKGHTCGFGYDKMAKKGTDKLCCKVQECTYRVELDDGLQGKWEQKLDGEIRLFPLQDFYGGEATRNSCFCCSEAGIPWNGNVNLKCKLGYEGSALLGAAAFVTFGLSNQVWKHSCQSYCSQFAGYTHDKKNFRAKVWVPAEIGSEIPAVDGPAVAAALTLELTPKVEEGKIAATGNLKNGTFDSEKLLDLSEDLREMLEQSEAAEVKEHMSEELLEDARKTLRDLDKYAMPQQVLDALEKMGQIYKYEPTNEEQKAFLLKTFEEIKAIVSKATDYVKETGEPLELLQSALDMLDELTEQQKQLD